MKIAVVSLFTRINGTTGDCLQANKTAEALSLLGASVTRCYLKPEVGLLYDPSGSLIGRWEDVLYDTDIVHAMVPFKFIRRLKRIKAKFTCYTVFWKSWNCVLVNVRNRGYVTIADVKDVIRILLSKIGIRTYGFYNGYDLLLANSEDEIRQVKKFCTIKADAIIASVPNAIDELPQAVANLLRPDCVPQEDYVVVPAFFAARKNQRTLIDALRETDYKVVFMGDGPLQTRCKRIATSNMIFLGHVEHGSNLFWSILRFARVVCLPSNCETPGIAGLEAAALGARPVIPYEGGTAQYYGWDGEYLCPTKQDSIRRAIEAAWSRGRLSLLEMNRFRNITWRVCAMSLLKCYETILRKE